MEEGDWVEEGQILAELENDRETIQLRKAELTLADKKRQLERSREMLAEELISQQEFDDVESAWQLAEAERDLARIALEETRIRAPFAGRSPSAWSCRASRWPPARRPSPWAISRPCACGCICPRPWPARSTAGQRVLVTPEAVDDRPGSRGGTDLARWSIPPPAPCA